VQRLWRALPKPQPKLLILTQPAHLIWAANFWISPFTFRANEAVAALLLTVDGQRLLAADHLLTPFALTAHVDEVIPVVWYDGLHTPTERNAVLMEVVGKAAKQLASADKVVWAGDIHHVPASLVDSLGPPVATDVGRLLARLRAVKDDDEVAVLRRSAQATAAGLRAAHQQLRPDMTELDLFQFVQQAVQQELKAPTSIYGDFVSGPRTALGGGGPSDRAIAAGDVVLVDFSAIVHGYRADVCTCWRLQAEWSVEQRRLVDLCLEAMAAARDELRPGRPARRCYQAMQTVFRQAGLAERFIHHAGHGIGLSHPEAPFLTAASDDDLAAGMVVTLEPGLYLPGEFGLRFEHNFLITAAGPERLTNHDPLPPR
jgi:Xaa-Pro aminopeptidase